MATQEVQTAERLARLETQHEELVRLMKQTHEDLREVKDSLTKWKGIGAGIVIAVSVIWAGVGAAVAFLTGHK